MERRISIRIELTLLYDARHRWRALVIQIFKSIGDIRRLIGQIMFQYSFRQIHKTINTNIKAN